MQTRNIARAVMLVALAVALSPLFIPVGITKCYPAQHLVNVVAAVLLGPWWAVGIAFLTAVIRNLTGLGTLFAFPGGMIGALLAGLAWRLTGNLVAAGAGEVVGTGIFGALASVWLVGPLLMGKTMALLPILLAFLVSSLGGAVLGIISLRLLRKAGIR